MVNILSILNPITKTLQLPVLFMICLLLPGCAGIRQDLLDLRDSRQRHDHIESNDFILEKNDDVIGRLAVIRIEKEDTLPDIARHYSLGVNTVSSANPGMDIWVPKPGAYLLLPLSFILPETSRKGIVINLAAMRLFHFKKNDNRLAVSTYPIGVGTPERPTPMGRMHIRRKKIRPTWYVPASIAKDHREKGDPLPAKVPPGPLNPLGDYALYLSKPSYLVHGTNKPASVGLRSTNGCIRLYPEDIKRLFESTPVKTPVRIVSQPYLVGQRDGVVYMEAHAPPDGTGSVALKKAYAKLKKIETESGRALDWNKIEKIVSEVRGFPVSVSENPKGNKTEMAEAIRLRHPVNLYGKPEVPELTTDAWYVMAALLSDKAAAQRLAAMINHQGPQIPARVLSSMGKHRVMAGPFDKVSTAENAAKRLKIDLELDGILVEPVEQE